MNSPKDYLTFEVKAQLVKHCIVITEVRVQILSKTQKFKPNFWTATTTV